jgi:hypothetical protein
LAKHNEKRSKASIMISSSKTTVDVSGEAS